MSLWDDQRRNLLNPKLTALSTGNVAIVTG